MKNLRTLIFVVVLICTSTLVNGQVLKNLKDKAKKTAKSVTGDKNKGNQSSTNSNNSQINVNNGASVPQDQSFNDFVREKAGMLGNYDYNLTESQIEGGEVKPDIHYASMKKLDYQSTIAKLKSHPKPDDVSFQYDELIAYQGIYKDLFDQRIKSYINSQIEEAWKQKQYNEATAIQNISNAKYMIDAALMMLPDNEAVKKLKSDVDNSFQTIAGAYYKKVYTSDFHEENVGKILFSNKPIVIGEEDPAQFKNEFSVNEKIYAVAYLNGTIKDLTYDSPKAFYYMEIDDENNYKMINFEHNAEDMALSFYPIEIIPATDQAIHGVDCIEFANILANISPRPHNFVVKLGTGYSKSLAEGSVKIDLTAMDGSKLKADAEIAAKNASDNYARNTKLPKSFSDPVSKFSDPELSEANMKALLMKEWNNCASILKLGVYGTASEDWLIYKNNLDIPVSKATYREVKAIFKGKDGWCYFVEGISFQREYSGGGTYSKVKFLSDGRHVKIDCKNVK
jgi:hypothetical protein